MISLHGRQYWESSNHRSAAIRAASLGSFRADDDVLILLLWRQY